jgi:protein-tyrosine-phosphatase
MSLVLFVCSENRTRSVISEYRLRDLLSHREGKLAREIEVASAGCGWTPEDIKTREAKGEIVDKTPFGLPPRPYVIESMKRRGFDISESRSKELNEAIAQEADLVIVFEDVHKESILRRYPTAEGKVFTLQELVGYEGYLINPYYPDGAWVFNSETNSWGFSDWYLEACITEIEHMLWWGLDKIIGFLKKP